MSGQQLFFIISLKARQDTRASSASIWLLQSKTTLETLDGNWNIKFYLLFITAEAFNLVSPIVQFVNINSVTNVLELLHKCLPH